VKITSAIPSKLSSAVLVLMLMLGVLLSWPASTLAQVAAPPPGPAAGAACVVSALNRNATMDGDYYVIPGVPSELGQYRIRAVCSDGTLGQTGIVKPAGGDEFVAGPIQWGSTAPIPKSLEMSGPANVSYGQSVQLAVTGKGGDGATWNATAGATGTNYVSSNRAYATVSADGVLTVPVPASGQNVGRQVTISATNEGTAVSRLIKIGPRGAIAGKVTQADGVTPVAGAQVTIQLNAPLTRFAVQTTDATGGYRLADAPAGDYTLSVLAPASGARASATGVLAANGSTATINLKLSAQGTVRVSATDSGQSVPGAQVTLVHAQYPGEVRSAQTGADGAAVIAGFSAGTFSVTVRNPVNGALATATASATGNGVTEVAVQLQGAGAIAGRVLQAALPQAGVQVRLLSAARGLVTQAISGAQGKFHFDALLLGDGPYTLQALHNGQLQGSAGGIVLAASGQEVQRDLVFGSFADGGSVSGKVLDGAGQRVAGIEVRLAAANGQRFTARTDAQGEYLIAGVSLGAFTVSVDANGLGASVEGTLKTNGEQVGVDLTLLGTGVVSGKLLLSSGQPATGATVVLRHALEDARQLTAGQDGEFDFGKTALGAYVLDVRHADGELALVHDGLTTPGEQRHHQLKLVGLTDLQVSVTEAGVPQAGVRVALALRGTLAAGYEAVTDAAGVARFDAVPRAPYGLTAMRAEGLVRKFARADSELRMANETATLELERAYHAQYSVSGRVLDDQARPVANAWVRLSTRDMPVGGIIAIDHPDWNEFLVRSDADGNYSFNDVILDDDGRGRVKLDVLIDGALRGRVIPTTPLDEASLRQDLVIYDVGVVVGALRTTKGNLVAGGRVGLTGFDDYQFSASDFIVRTDDGGRYAIVAPPATYRIVARPLDGGATAGMTLELRTMGQAVETNSSINAAAAYLQARIDSTAVMATATVTVNGRNIATLNGSGTSSYLALAIGTHELKVQTSYGETITRQITVLPADDHRIITETVMLRPAILSITLASTYAEEILAVTIDGKLAGYGRNGHVIGPTPLDKGTHTVTVTGVAGVTKSAQVVVTAAEAGKALTTAFAFNPARLRLRVLGSVENPAEIHVNGKYAVDGWTIDRLYYDLKQGLNVVTVSKKNEPTRTIEFQVDALDDGREYDATFVYRAAWMKVKVSHHDPSATTHLLFIGGHALGDITGNGELEPFVVREGTYVLRAVSSTGTAVNYPVTVNAADEGRTLEVALGFVPSQLNINVFNSSAQGLTSVTLNGESAGNVTGNGMIVTRKFRVGRNELSAITADGVMQHATVDIAQPENVTATVDFVFDELLAKRGRLRFDGERHLYAVAVKPGDRLTIAARGMAVDGDPAVPALRWETYTPGMTLASSAITRGEPFNYEQQLVYGSPQAIAVTAAGHYTIALNANAYSQRGGYTVSAAINGQPVELLPFQGGATIQGTVYRGGGVTPAVGAVLALQSSGTPGVHLRTETDAAGRYRFEHLPPGDLTLTALKESEVLVRADVPASAGEVITQDLQLPSMTSVQVSVRVDSALPLPSQVTVLISDRDGERYAGQVNFTDGRTSDTLSVQPLGDTFTLSATHPSKPLFATNRTFTASDNETQTVVLDLAAAQYSGRIMRSGGVPASWSEVRALRADTLAQLDVTSADQDGRYALVLPVGVDVILRVRDSSTGGEISLPVKGSAGGLVAVPDILLSGTASLTGQVRYDTGAAIAYAGVELSATIDGKPFTRYANSRADGVFLFDELPTSVPFTVSVTAGTFDHTVTQQAILTSVGQVLAMPDFVFSEGNSLTIRLLDGDRKPNEKLHHVFAECGAKWVYVHTAQGMIELQADRLSPDRLQPIVGLEPGPFRVDVAHACKDNNNRPFASATGTIVAGQPATVDVVIPILSGTVKYSDGRLVTDPYVQMTQFGEDGSELNAFGQYDWSHSREYSHHGSFDIVGVQPGIYRLTSYGYDNDHASVTGMLEDRVNLKADIVIPAPPYLGRDSDVIGAVRIGGVLKAGVEVRLLGSDGYERYVETNERGIYEFAGVEAGPLTVGLATDAATASGVAGTAPVITLDLAADNIPHDGSESMVEGIVTIDGQPAAGVTVTLEAQWQTLQAETDAAGLYQFSRVPLGPFTVSAGEAWSSASASATSGAAAQVRLDLAMRNEPFDGSASYVSGAVTANGSTLAGVEVRLAGAEQTLSGITDYEGRYRFERVKAGPFTLSAAYDGLSANIDGTAGATQFVTLNLVLQEPVQGTRISGVVRYSNGAGVADPEVTVFQDGRTRFASSDGAGNYVVDGIQPGFFELTAQDAALSGLATTVTGAATDSPVALDVKLPPSATISGVARDVAGRPLADMWIYGQSSAAVDIDRSVQADAQGRFTLAQMALGTVRFGVYDDLSGLIDSASVALARDGQAVTRDLRLPAPAGILSGRVLDADNAPVPDAEVVLRAEHMHGPVGQVYLRATTDRGGAFVFEQPPAGRVRLMARAPNFIGAIGMADVTTETGKALQADVVPSPLADASLTLEGTDGYRYGLGCDSELYQGGPADQVMYFANMLALRVDSQRFACEDATIPSPDAREFVYGPTSFDQVRAARRIFAPEAGGFVRYIDSYTNTGSAAVTVNVRVGNTYMDVPMQIVTAPSATQQRYAVFDQPSFGQVSGGAGATQPAGSFVYAPPNKADPNSGRLSYARTLTIAAGATVSLMHFAILASDPQAVEETARQLSTNSAPSMFDRIDARDKAAIINFSVP